ncbi:arabinosaccharide transport system permease protein [Orenia metallireducens]|jgi:arabinosaccharide transport system permease protein|uniref:Arabinosaccharide transport system permease protein n=1 Tax=Orenia metallireducens TaxID=1413210 RepID=A0A285H3Z7_9FIRM|nr:sugar ABC transporter permease [Orenia metallireducens]PRX29506.1 arabinosaccharide transport system permease protein [Orenia metallireducens]SNY30304.1 arabinosaccharide transport system permease protein [Orenia metallireducens]
MIRKILNDKKKAPWLFIAPFLLLFTVFKVGPILYSIFLSFYKMKGLNGGEFVGLNNYVDLFHDSNFIKAVVNNTKYMIGTMITLIPLPLIFAVLLDSKHCKGKTIYKAILFIPSLTSLVIAAAVFKILLYEGETGIVNSLLGLIGIPAQKWLISPGLAIPAVLLIATWRWTGINMIYFTTGLTGISKEMYEAAAIDGANMLQRFYHITLPLLKPVIIFVATLNLIGGYQLFTEVYMLWNAGASPDNGALTLAVYLYKTAFSYFKLGYASTIGLVMGLIILILTLVQLKFTGFFKDEV